MYECGRSPLCRQHLLPRLNWVLMEPFVPHSRLPSTCPLSISLCSSDPFAYAVIVCVHASHYGNTSDHAFNRAILCSVLSCLQTLIIRFLLIALFCHVYLLYRSWTGLKNDARWSDTIKSRFMMEMTEPKSLCFDMT